MASLLDKPLYLYSIPAVWFSAFYPGSLRVSIFLIDAHTYAYSRSTNNTYSSWKSTTRLGTTSTSWKFLHGLIIKLTKVAARACSISPRAQNLPGRVTASNAQTLAQMEGAHLNGNENMPIWFAAIVSTTYRMRTRWLVASGSWEPFSEFDFELLVGEGWLDSECVCRSSGASRAWITDIWTRCRWRSECSRYLWTSGE